MHKLIDFFLDRSVLVNTISIMIVVMGIASIYSLRKETFPNVDFDVITIRVNYPGSSTEDTEKLVGIEVERALKEVDGIKEINVLSGEGYSITNLEIDTGYVVDDVLEEVRSSLDSITDSLPEEAEEPIIKKINNKQRGIFKIALMGDDEWRMREVAKNLRDYLELHPGVARININGYRDEVVEVAVDPKKLNRYELTINQVSEAIRDRNINLSAGTAETKKADIMIRTQSEFVDKRDVEEVVVRSNASGAGVKVSEIAEVKTILKDTKEEQRLNKKFTLFLEVVSKEFADIINTTDQLFERTDKFFEIYKIKDLKYEIVDDMSFYVKRRLRILTTNGTQGMILVLIALIAFMNFRVSVITSLGAPIAFMVAFTVMTFFNVTINLISMFGLILVLGMLVDDSIIVAELFYQYVEQGMDPKKAARKAAVDTLLPVTATIITTMIAFGSLFFMGGIMGKFLWPVPAAVIICLIASWFECFFILPSHLADFTKPNIKVGKKKWYQPFYNLYEKTLKIALKHYVISITFFFAAAAGVGIYAKSMRFELFPGDDVTVVYVNLKAPVGTPINVTNEALKIAEDISLKELKEDELENLRSILGNAMGGKGAAKKGAHYASLIFYITMADLRDRSTDEMMNAVVEKMRKKITTHEVTFDRFQNGPPKGKPINVELSGDSIPDLKVVAKELKEKLANIDGITSIDVDFEEGKKQVIIDIDEFEARRLGLSNRQIAFEIRGVFEGLISTEIRRNDEDIDVVVRYDEEARSSLKSLEKIFILNNMGERIKLSQVASYEEVPGAFVIRRYQRKRTISVAGEIDLKKTTVGKMNQEIKPIIEETIASYPKISFEQSGEQKDTKESMGGLIRAAMIAMFGIFIVLLMNFGSLGQPLIIMSTIPLGLIGVVITFSIFGLPLSFMAFMGIVGLVGVVVNDSIVLVTFINERLNKISDPVEAVKDGALSRFRAVVLTTLTTSAGLLPIAHATGGDPFLKPMATSFAYGLMFATTITLVFVPCVYLAYHKMFGHSDGPKGTEELLKEADATN
jgi:multidrug efflux pump subunit AcrB